MKNVCGKHIRKKIRIYLISGHKVFFALFVFMDILLSNVDIIYLHTTTNIIVVIPMLEVKYYHLSVTIVQVSVKQEDDQNLKINLSQ